MKTRLIGLDLARAFAAVIVMLFHLGYFNFPELKFFWVGRYGVEIFFVISGFVIAFSANRSSASQFIINRFLRLYPAAFIGASLTLIVLLIARAESKGTLLLQYLNTILFNPFKPWIDVVYWTLGIEVAFYAVIAIALIMNFRRRLEAICYLIGIYSSLMWLLHALGLFPPAWPRLAMLLLAPYGVYFAFGAALWAGTMLGWTRIRVAMALCLGLSGYAGMYRAHMVWTADTNQASPFIAPSIWAMAIIVMLLITWLERRYANRISELAYRAIRFIGLTTYPLYLIHYFIGRQVLWWLFAIGANRWLALLISCASVVGLAMVITAFIEPYLRRKMRMWIDGKFPQAVPAIH